MARKIVILMDGTSNEIHADRSNILRLYGTLKKSEQQLVYYDPGVGTFGGDFPLSKYYGEAKEVLQRMLGWGLDDNVKEAYRFLVEHHARGTGEEQDQIFLFGFSRGAYSVRVLAGFLRAFGLMEKRNLNLLDHAYRAYKAISDDDSQLADRNAARGDAAPDYRSFEEIRLYERVLSPYRAPIRFMGVFDTVSSVIERGRVGLSLRKHAFTHTNSMVEIMRHAVATDERRCMFRPDLWKPGQSYAPNPFALHLAKSQDFKEVWFPGVHGDVGGGYPEGRSHLAKIPLAWMIREAGQAGLEFNTATVNRLVLGRQGKRPHKYVPPNALARAHESMNFWWELLEYFPQRVRPEYDGPSVLGWYLPLKEPRAIPEGALIHASVLERRARGLPVYARFPQKFEVEPAVDPAVGPGAQPLADGEDGGLPEPESVQGAAPLHEE